MRGNEREREKVDVREWDGARETFTLRKSVSVSARMRGREKANVRWNAEGGISGDYDIFSLLSSAHLIFSKLGKNWSQGTQSHPYQISYFCRKWSGDLDGKGAPLSGSIAAMPEKPNCLLFSLLLSALYDVSLLSF